MCDGNEGEGMTDALRELAWRHVKAKEAKPLTSDELGDLRDALGEFERLQRIEAAARPLNCEPDEGIAKLRGMAEQARLDEEWGFSSYLLRLADALEATG